MTNIEKLAKYFERCLFNFIDKGDYYEIQDDDGIVLFTFGHDLSDEEMKDDLIIAKEIISCCVTKQLEVAEEAKKAEVNGKDRLQAARKAIYIDATLVYLSDRTHKYIEWNYPKGK